MRQRDPRRILRRRREVRARVQIIETPHGSRAEDGAVTTKQVAAVTMARSELDRMWNAEYLERLARTYWRFLTRISLGLIRVHYGPDSREIVFVAKPFVLLRFFAPEYDTDADQGTVTWRINKGFLVAPQGRGKGFLRISVERKDDPDTEGEIELRVYSEVANFYPLLAGWGWWKRIGGVIYRFTQYTIHNIVTNAFFNSLASLDLEESRVGKFREADSGLTDSASGDLPELGAVVPSGDPANRS